MDINMVNDIFIIAKQDFLGTRRYMNDESFEKEKNEILNKLFTKKEITEYNQFLIDESDTFRNDLIPLTTNNR